MADYDNTVISRLIEKAAAEEVRRLLEANGWNNNLVEKLKNAERDISALKEEVRKLRNGQPTPYIPFPISPYDGPQKDNWLHEEYDSYKKVNIPNTEVIHTDSEREIIKRYRPETGDFETIIMNKKTGKRWHGDR